MGMSRFLTVTGAVIVFMIVSLQQSEEHRTIESQEEELKLNHSKYIRYVTKNKRNMTLQSAKSLLYQPPPYRQEDIYQLASELETSPNTIVSAYFRISSKHSSAQYDEWMQNFLGLKDNMVIFTSEDMLAKVSLFRKHARGQTVVIIMSVDDLPLAKLYSESFWQDQLAKDPEKQLHKSYKLFWIWLSKSFFVHEALRLNFFGSDLFMWCDFGSFRQFSERYWGKQLIRHREVVPANEMLQMAFQPPVPPSKIPFADKQKYERYFYHSGMHSVAYAKTWEKFYPLFLDTIDKFLGRNLGICDDQVVLQSCCLLHPELCAYVKSSEVPNDRRFRALRYVLHVGGKYNFWRYKNSTIK
ncbi:hypothetical protein ACHAWF_001869 [Thalassiosira exigua]